MPAVVLERAAATIGGRTVWRGVDVSVGAGEFVALLGPNGAGKTTLLRVILGALPPSAGTVSVLGGAPRHSRSRVAYLPQRRTFDPDVRIRGWDLVRLGLDGHRWGVPLPFGRRHEPHRVDAAIDVVGASAYARRPIGEMSGGEQQRLLVAQALVRRPELLLLDEPLDSLDLPNQSAVSALIDRIRRDEGIAVVLVAHDVNPLLPYLDRVVYLAGGKAVQGSPEDVITTDTLTRLYGTPIEVLRASDGRLVVVGNPEAPAVHADRHRH
jgi:zinc/manganese transport system ATP-binding protein